MSEPIYFRFKPGEQSLQWEFKIPETDFLIKADSRAALIRNVIVYRKNNLLAPYDNIEMTVDEYLCRLPCNAGKCKPDQPLRRGVAAYFKGGIMIFKSMFFGTFASPAVAEKRASQCKECPFNVFPESKQRFIKWTDSVAVASVGSRRVSCHNELGNCDACSCQLRAKVWWGDKVSLTEEQKAKMETVKCWQLNIQE